MTDKEDMWQKGKMQEGNEEFRRTVLLGHLGAFACRGKPTACW